MRWETLPGPTLAGKKVSYETILLRGNTDMIIPTNKI